LEEDLYASQYFALLRRNWLFVLALTTLGGIIGVVLILFVLPRQWRAATSVIFETQSQGLALPTTVPGMQSLASKFGLGQQASSAANMALAFGGSQTVRLEAIERLDLPSRLGRGVFLVPEDRQGAGIFPSLSVAHNMTLASLRAHVRRLALSPSAERETVARMASELAIASAVPEIRIGALSGGNQQKVVIARALLTRPRVLLLDEPTRGIDVGAKAELRGLVRRLAEGGVGIVFVSSDLEEVVGVADRIVVLSNGRVTGRFAASEASHEELVAAAARGHGRSAGKDAA